MINLDNKTKLLDEVDLLSFKTLIEKNPCHIATVNKYGKPNLSIVSNTKVLDSTTILISNNEMVHTPDNIIETKNVSITCFNSKWCGVRLSGYGFYYEQGEHFEMCNKLFATKTTLPKGAIVITVYQVEIIE